MDTKNIHSSIGRSQRKWPSRYDSLKPQIPFSVNTMSQMMKTVRVIKQAGQKRYHWSTNRILGCHENANGIEITQRLTNKYKLEDNLNDPDFMSSGLD